MYDSRLGSESPDGEASLSLWQDFQTNDGKIIHKWVHYFPIYERHFSWYRNKSLTFLEIGVARGGSLGMWQRYFGPLAKIVGIDIEEKCKAAEAPGIFVRIGDQSDEKFLQSIIDEFGVPDVVLDDGSHLMDLTAKSFKFLYPRMPKNAVYMVEDLHTAYWSEFGGGLNEPGTFINLAKGFVDKLNADHSRGQVEPDYITRQTFGISFYDSIVVLEKGDVWRKDSIRVGRRPLFT
ncbi:MAG: class I SAM-dependent methyltransferase [Steroidobacteraceae bacterium]